MEGDHPVDTTTIHKGDLPPQITHLCHHLSHQVVVEADIEITQVTKIGIKEVAVTANINKEVDQLNPAG